MNINFNTTPANAVPQKAACDRLPASLLPPERSRSGRGSSRRARPSASRPNARDVGSGLSLERIEKSVAGVDQALRVAARSRSGVESKVWLSWATVDPADPAGSVNVAGFGSGWRHQPENLALVAVGVPDVPAEDNCPSLWAAVMPLWWNRCELEVNSDLTQWRSLVLSNGFDSPDGWPPRLTGAEVDRLAVTMLVAGRQIADVHIRNIRTDGHFQPLRFRCKTRVWQDDLVYSAEGWGDWNTVPIALDDAGDLTGFPSSGVSVFVPGPGMDVSMQDQWSAVEGVSPWAVFHRSNSGDPISIRNLSGRIGNLSFASSFAPPGA